jgi:D-glycero-D-manno-heptose 1,7-bisphosphate phosphatase
MKRAVFLDRDGVILDHSGSVFPGVKKQLDRLKDAGFFLGLATNQPDIATHKIKREIVDRVNTALQRVVPLDAIAVCPHIDADKCPCRKPKDGMLRGLAHKHGLDLPRSFMVGDRWRDITAGVTAGCTTLLIGTGYGEPFPNQPTHRAADLEIAVDIIVGTA